MTSSSMMSTLMKNRPRREEQKKLSKCDPNRKRFHTAALDNVEEALIKWFHDQWGKKKVPGAGLCRRRRQTCLPKTLAMPTSRHRMGGLPVSRREITSDNSVCVAKALALTLLAITQD